MKSVDQLHHLEDLVEELIKDKPQDDLVRAYMRAAGLKYTADPVERMKIVFAELEKVRVNSSKGPRNEKDFE
ncbi:MAG TPA: hypothetical protein VM432_14400 [Bdellovibrionales bacterium]|nr:hypothetical protein [Bdellovibrionales bacterium]